MPPGDYNVQLHFAELDSTINASTNTRRADIYIEGKLMRSNYSPRESTGAIGKAEVLNFDVTVSDWYMELEIYRSGSSHQSPRISGISVRKKHVW
jgi:hypothetical protein